MTDGDCQDSYAVVDGLRVRYLAAGMDKTEETEGPAVLLVHGASPDHASLSWRKTIPELSGRHRVIAVDLPGNGLSDKPRLDYSAEYYAGFLGRFVDALDIYRASIVGLSLGGAASLGYALENPERVERLVLVDSYGLSRSPPAPGLSRLLVQAPPLSRAYSALLRRRWLLRWSLGRFVCGSPGNVEEDLVDEVLDRVRDPETGRVSAAIREAEAGSGEASTNYLSRLGEVRVPTLLLHGARDRVVPACCSKAAHRMLPDSRLHIFEDCGHWPPRERPEEFNRILASFLEDTRTGACR